jgi:hypothetical protein
MIITSDAICFQLDQKCVFNKMNMTRVSSMVIMALKLPLQHYSLFFQLPNASWSR